jgi:hypothetical protein
MHGSCIYILHENNEPEHFYTLSNILEGKILTYLTCSSRINVFLVVFMPLECHI